MKTLRTLIAPAILATLMLTSQVEAEVNYDSLVVTNQGAIYREGGTVSWKATVMNPFSDTAYFNVVYKFLDSSGFIVVKQIESDFKVGPKCTRSLSDVFNMDPRAFAMTARVEMSIEEDKLTQYLNGLKK